MPAITSINSPLSPALSQANTSALPIVSGRPTENPLAANGRPSTLVSISSLGRAQVARESVGLTQSEPPIQVDDASTSSADTATDSERQLKAREKHIELAEQQQIKELSARDREVRNHEQAHANAGGQYAGAPVYEFQRGPDGVNYAVGGHVSIDASAIPGDPEATIIKAAQVKRAALAPAEPSPQDRKVAALATQTQLQAQADLAEARQQERLDKIEKTVELSNSESDKPVSGADKAASVNQSLENQSPQNDEIITQPEPARPTANFISSSGNTSAIGSLINQLV